MAPQQIVFALVTFLHDLFTAVWIGGLITLGLIVMPAARSVLGMGKQTRQLMGAIKKRLSVLVYISMVVLAVTGVLMSRRAPQATGFMSFANPYSTVLSVKHLLMVGMILAAIGRSQVVTRLKNISESKQDKLNAGLLMLNIVFGIAILLLTGFLVALGAGGPPGM